MADRDVVHFERGLPYTIRGCATCDALVEIYGDASVCPFCRTAFPVGKGRIVVTGVDPEAGFIEVSTPKRKR